MGIANKKHGNRRRRSKANQWHLNEKWNITVSCLRDQNLLDAIGQAK